MATTYIKADQPAFSLQMSNFSIKLNGYKTMLHFTDNEIANYINDAAALQWVSQGLKKADKYQLPPGSARR